MDGPTPAFGTGDCKVASFDPRGSHALDRARALAVERVVLGEILIDPTAIGRVGAELDVSLFSTGAHQAILTACRAVSSRGEPVELVTVEQELRREKQVEWVGGAAYLAGLLDSVTGSRQLQPHIRLLQEKATLRRIQDVTLAVTIKAGADIEGPDTILADLDGALAGLRRDRATRGSPLLEGEGSAEELLHTEFDLEPSYIEGFLYPGGCSFIVGEGGVGKTTLGFQLCRALASGEPIFRLATRSCVVGFLATETAGRYAKARMRALAHQPTPPDWTRRVFIRAPGYPKGFPRRWDITDAAVRAQIIEWVRVKGIQVLILDPFAHFHRLDENVTQDMNAVTAALDDIRDATNVAIIILHHVAKGESKSRQRGRGSTVPYDYADAELALEATRDDLIKAHWSKDPRNDAAPPAFYLRMTPEGVLELANHAEGSRAKRIGDQAARIVDVLAAVGMPMAPKVITEALAAHGLDLRGATLTRRLQDLVKDGKVRWLDGGQYEVAKDGSISTTDAKAERNEETR